MLEVVDHMTQEREPNVKLYTMLLGALRALATHDHPLVAPAFFWKLLALEGFRPMVDACVICQREDELCAFDLDEGGVMCVDHRRGIALTPAALALLQSILGGRLASVLAQPQSPATIDVEHLATRAIEHHLERRIRSIGVLDRG
jgi:DNA repair protein RecO (recombination protein O)